MQEELVALQPELKKTQEETEKLMGVIEKDAVEVEAKKQVRYYETHMCVYRLRVIFVGCGR